MPASHFGIQSHFAFINLLNLITIPAQARCAIVLIHKDQEVGWDKRSDMATPPAF